VAGPSLDIPGVDADAIAAALVAALGNEDERRRVRAAGPGWAKSFSWDASVARHIAVYKETAFP
jgi:hypothetical protein